MLSSLFGRSLWARTRKRSQGPRWGEGHLVFDVAGQREVLPLMQNQKGPSYFSLAQVLACVLVTSERRVRLATGGNLFGTGCCHYQIKWHHSGTRQVSFKGDIAQSLFMEKEAQCPCCKGRGNVPPSVFNGRCHTLRAPPTMDFIGTRVPVIPG